MSFFAKGGGGRGLAIAVLTLSVVVGCGKPYAAQLSAVEGLLSAARSSDEARAGELMPSLLKLSTVDRERALAALAALGEHELAGISRCAGGYVVSLRFGKAGATRTISFPVLSDGGLYTIGDVVTTEERIDMVPLNGKR